MRIASIGATTGESMDDYDLSKIQNDQHSPIIGWADGYPIYGMYGYNDDQSALTAITSSYVIERTQDGGDQETMESTIGTTLRALVTWTNATEDSDLHPNIQRGYTITLARPCRAPQQWLLTPMGRLSA